MRNAQRKLKLESFDRDAKLSKCRSIIVADSESLEIDSEGSVTW